MGRKRGALGTFLHEMEKSNKRRQQQQRAAARAQAQAARHADQLRRQHQAAVAQMARASAAEQKAAEREAKRLHDEYMSAEADERNATLAATYDEIDSLLAQTLDVDDFVDLERLRVRVEHPPFPRHDLEQPLPPPAPLQPPLQPVYQEPEAPGGLKAVFAGRKHAEAVERSRAEFAQQYQLWQRAVAELPAAQIRQMQHHAAAEEQRKQHLAAASSAYQRQCQEREQHAAAQNAPLDALIAGLQAGHDAAVQEYVGIVLSNSVYPDAFPVEHDYEFDSSLRELALTVLVPSPSALPATKEFKYVKAKNEIVESTLPQKAQKDRYASAIAQVALRSLHEIFEADRTGWIQTIALTVATEALNQATGLMERTPLVAVATDRRFERFDLSNVVPQETLAYLGAQISKNPFGLVPIDTSHGVRG